MTDRPLDTDRTLRRYDSLEDMIGVPEDPTPMVRLNRIVPAGIGPVFVKLEWMNPFGSIKDRTAKWLLDGLEERGELGDNTIVEATSGNTGIALSALSALRGRPMSVTVPHDLSAEKTVLLRALGARVDYTPSEAAAHEHPMDTAAKMAAAMVAEGGYVMPNQYDNPDNVRAHYESTGPEIWRQTEGAVRYFFAGFGTCGTLTGVAKYLKEQDPSIIVVGVEPVEGHHISGLKNLTETATPKILDRSFIDEVIPTDDDLVAETMLRLHREEALMVGPTGAAIIGAALRFLESHEPGVAVTVSPDGSLKAGGYLAQILGE